MDWEFDFLKFVIDNLHNDFLTEIMRIITTSGNLGLIWIIITAVFIALPKMRKTGFTMATSLVIVLIVVNVLIKPAVNRIRPFQSDIDILNSMLIALPKDGSFPSGHTAAAFSTAVACFMCNKRWGIALLIWAVLIALSRLYFAVHFPTDVIGGFVIGILIGILSYKICEKKEEKN